MLAKTVKTSTDGIKKAIFSIPVIGWILVAVEAVGFLISGLDELFDTTKKYEKANKKFNDANDIFKETVSEIKELNDELDASTKRLEELRKLKNDGVATTAELSELSALERQTKELESQIKLLKQKEELQRKEKDEAAIKAYRKWQEADKDGIFGWWGADNHDRLNEAQDIHFNNESTYSKKAAAYTISFGIPRFSSRFNNMPIRATAHKCSTS